MVMGIAGRVTKEEKPEDLGKFTERLEEKIKQIINTDTGIKAQQIIDINSKNSWMSSPPKGIAKNYPGSGGYGDRSKYKP
ncbi:hypothetical protein KY358_06990 [Candidatus Woesearchaeota archaeon]|nr:hypothetical protein [Candidatus Woesearchaeota archaeon]